MKTFAQALALAEQTTKRDGKVAAFQGLGQDEQRLILEALNPYRVFNTKKWDEPSSYAASDASFAPFFELLDYLHDRTLTGNAARLAVVGVLSQYTKATADALARVIRKDLKCGADASTFEKIFPNLNIPSFEVMLCGKIEGDYTKHPFQFPLIAEVKYDGNRLIAKVENGEVVYLSRNGRPSDFCEGIFDAELVKLEQVIGEPIVVDGEVLADGGYQATQQAKGSENSKDGLRFFAFDYMTLAQWKARSCPMKQLERTESLERLIKQVGCKLVVKSDWRVLKTIEQVTDFYIEVIEQGVAGMDEGLILKELDGSYEWDRSSVWLKLKPVYDVDLKIVGYFEGTKGTKNEGKLGGFYVEGTDENGRVIASAVGGFKVSSSKFKNWFKVFAKANKIDTSSIKGLNKTGTVSFDQFFREFALCNFDLFKGQTATMEVAGFTLADGSTKWSLRFPQFTHLRDDK